MGTVEIQTGAGPKSVKATIYGGFALHRTVGLNARSWRLTHVASGHAALNEQSAPSAGYRDWQRMGRELRGMELPAWPGKPTAAFLKAIAGVIVRAADACSFPIVDRIRRAAGVARKADPILDPFKRKMVRETLRYAVQRQIFCPGCETILDVGSAVLIEHGSDMAILCPRCADKLPAGYRERCDVTDGRTL